MSSSVLVVLLGVISLAYARQQLSCELRGKCLYCEESGQFGYSACRQQSDCATNEVCRSHSNRQDAYCCARGTVVVSHQPQRNPQQYIPTTSGGGSQFCFDGSVGYGRCTHESQCNRGDYCHTSGSVCCRNRGPPATVRRSCDDIVCPSGRVCQFANNQAICVSAVPTNFQPPATQSPLRPSRGNFDCQQYPVAPRGCTVSGVRKHATNGCYSYSVNCRRA